MHAPRRPLTRSPHDFNICSRNLTDGAGRQGYLLLERAAPVLLSTCCFLRTERQPILMEVTQYEPALVAYRYSTSSGRSAQLWVSLLWLCALGPLWRGGARPPRDVPHRPTLTEVQANNGVAPNR